MWKEIRPGEPLKKGTWLCNMKYDPFPENMKDVLIALWKSCGSLKKFLSQFNDIFGDGIRVEQKELGIPSPYYLSTHARLVTQKLGDHLLVFSQDLTTSEKEYSETDIWAQMVGDTPHIRAFKPLFIYGE
jgi:hypothetical protein